MKTRQVAYTAMIAALSVLVLYLSSVIPTARLAVIAVAGILPAFLVVKYGIMSGFLAYFIVSVLSLIVLPNKSAVLLYIVLFGHYPMVKSLIERIGRLWFEWVLKLAFFNVIATALLLLAPGILTGFAAFGASWPVGLVIAVLYIVGNIVFIIYDIGFTGLIAAIISRLAKWM